MHVDELCDEEVANKPAHVSEGVLILREPLKQDFATACTHILESLLMRRKRWRAVVTAPLVCVSFVVEAIHDEPKGPENTSGGSRTSIAA